MKAKLLALFLGWQGIAAIVVGSTVSLYGAFKWVQYTGVKKERARVVKQAEKTDAKAAVRRRDAERDPDGVLGRYYRD